MLVDIPHKITNSKILRHYLDVIWTLFGRNLDVIKTEDLAVGRMLHLDGHQEPDFKLMFYLLNNVNKGLENIKA